MAEAVTASLTVLAMVLAATGLGLAMLRPLRAGLSAAELWLAAPLAGAVPLALAVAAVGWFRYTPAAMAAVLAVAGGLAALPLARARPTLPALPAAPLLRAILAVAALFVAVATLTAFAPPSDHDTLRYHLTLPRRDLELGRIAQQFGWSVYEFFPPLAALLTRLAYALGGAAAAQLLNVAWMVAAAAWAGALAVRLGGGAATAALAGLLLLSQRVMVNLAGAVTADFAQIAYLAAAASAGLLLLRHPAAGWRQGVLLGLMLGAALETKYQAGFLAAPLMAALLLDRLAGRRPLAPLLLAGVVAAALFAPLLLRNAWMTGNPVFPLLHPLFGADNVDIFGGYLATSRTRPYPGGLPLAPLTIFLNQLAYDGLQFGFPILLIGIPFAFAERGRDRLICLGAALAFLVEWWVAMPHLLRFLQPLLGILAALAALGLASAAKAGAGLRHGRAALAALAGLAALVQFALLGSTALYRLPAALGLQPAEAMLEGPEFHHYSLYAPCRWLEERLRPGERYLPVVNAPSYYCPQAPAMQTVPPAEAARYYTEAGLEPVAAAELARRLEEQNVRYVLRAQAVGPGDEAYVFAKHRFDALLLPLLPTLSPLMTAPSGFVYDGRDVAAALRRTADQDGTR